MKRIMMLAALLLVVVMDTFAQSQRFDVLATAHRDMQTEKFGQLTEVDFKIKYEPKYFVVIAADTFRIANEKDELQADSSGYAHKEITATDNKGDEYIITINSDPSASAELMRHFVIKFSTAKPYDWTYYFTEPSKKED